MASICLAERGDCLLDLGRLDEAATAYEEIIRRAEQLGYATGTSPSARVSSGLSACISAATRRRWRHMKKRASGSRTWTNLACVAVSWHQTGSVYQGAGQPEAAEDAYRKSLEIKVRLGDVAGQASTLLQLGTLYGDVLARPKDAAAFYEQAADKYGEIGDAANEGRVRSNLAMTLRKLRRLDESRQEIRRAIACNAQFGHAVEPWKSWAILADIETDAGNPAAAAEAKSQGHRLLPRLPPRRRREPQPEGRISLGVTQALLAGDSADAASLLQQLAAHPDAAGPGATFIHALQAIVAGSRDRTLADAPELDCTMAAEILFLIDTLEQLPHS